MQLFLPALAPGRAADGADLHSRRIAAKYLSFLGKAKTAAALASAFLPRRERWVFSLSSGSGSMMLLEFRDARWDLYFWLRRRRSGSLTLRGSPFRSYRQEGSVRSQQCFPGPASSSLALPPLGPMAFWSLLLHKPGSRIQAGSDGGAAHGVCFSRFQRLFHRAKEFFFTGRHSPGLPGFRNPVPAGRIFSGLRFGCVF